MRRYCNLSQGFPVKFYSVGYVFGLQKVLYLVIYHILEVNLQWYSMVVLRCQKHLQGNI